MRIYADPDQVTPDNWHQELNAETFPLVLDRAHAAYWYAVGREDAGDTRVHPLDFRHHHAAEAARFHRGDVDCYFLHSVPDSYAAYLEGQG